MTDLPTPERRAELRGLPGRDTLTDAELTALLDATEPVQRIEALIENLDVICGKMKAAGLGRCVGRVRAAIAQLRADHPAQVGAPFPQPSRNDGGVPCGECHLRAGETCDVCGAEQGGGDATAAGDKWRVFEFRGVWVPVADDDLAALSAAVGTLRAMPGVEALLADWVEGWNGFSEAEIRRRTDHVTFNRIMKTRAALRRLGGEGRG